MFTVFDGTSGNLSDCRFAIIVSTYHRNITSKLLEAAQLTLTDAGVASKAIDVVWVPGAWEIPLAASQAIDYRKVDAVICLGCVIRGETSHDQHINNTVSNLLGTISVDREISISFGILTCNSLEQAVARSGGEVGNKGVEAAEAALHMVRLSTEMEK